MGPGQDHRRRPRAAARPRLQRLIRSTLVTQRVVEVAPARLDGWLDRLRRQQPRRPPAGRRGRAFRPRPARRRARAARRVCRGRGLGRPAHRPQGRHPLRAVPHGRRRLEPAALRPPPGEPGRRAGRCRRRSTRVRLLTGIRPAGVGARWRQGAGGEPARGPAAGRHPRPAAARALRPARPAPRRAREAPSSAAARCASPSTSSRLGSTRPVAADEGVALVEVAGLEALEEPALARLGRAVRPALGVDPALGGLLDAVVADRGGRRQRVLDVLRRSAA